MLYLKSCLAVIFFFCTAALPAFAADDRFLTVAGEGRIASAPDMATVSLGVQREARDAAAAMTAASEAAAAVFSSLQAAGIAPADVQTTRIGLDPRYARTDGTAPPRITGYIASNDLVITVRDLAALGTLLDSALSEGANTFRGLSFGIADRTELAAEARADAVQDAITRARTLSAAAGVTLGPVQSIVEGGASFEPQPMMRGAMMADAAVPIAQGEVDVTARVTMVFSISD